MPRGGMYRSCIVKWVTLKAVGDLLLPSMIQRERFSVPVASNEKVLKLLKKKPSPLRIPALN